MKPKPEDLDYLDSLCDMGEAYLKIGRIGEGIMLLEENVEKLKLMLEPEDAGLLHPQRELAYAYLEIGRVEEAIALLEGVAEIRQLTLGPEHPARQASEELLSKALRRKKGDRQDTSPA